VNGWCIAVQQFSSVSNANIGNSTIHEKFIVVGS